jgi:hypothetical protein
MVIQWFLNNDEDISGPFSTEDIQKQIETGLPKDCFIWGKAQKDWITVRQWSASLPTLLHTSDKKLTSLKWHMAREGKSEGPYAREDLLHMLSNLSSLEGVMLWNKEMTGWVSVFDLHELMEEIGVDRRHTPRAKIRGTVKVTSGDISSIGQIQTLSEGGLGIIGLENGFPGQELQVEIRAAALGGPIRAKAEIKYVTKSGFTGLHFTQISMEAKSTLIDYIRHTTHPSYGKAA